MFSLFLKNIFYEFQKKLLSCIFFDKSYFFVKNFKLVRKKCRLFLLFFWFYTDDRDLFYLKEHMRYILLSSPINKCNPLKIMTINLIRGKKLNYINSICGCFIWAFIFSREKYQKIELFLWTSRFQLSNTL